ncbi:MAG: hypothetical protein WC677_08795 [Clostridia bacterium]|jgi:hypothetical protein
MIKQQIKKIKVEDLHLWTENPRDPFDVKASDYDIIKRAIEDPNQKWDLPKMLEEMGQHYDLSELPTVVEIKGRYIIYDGNRRVAVLKFIQNKSIYESFGGGMFPQLEPKELRELKEIPCNVCENETALVNVERKHTNSGSWGALERDYFLNVHRGQEKTVFQVIDERTRLISQNPKLNQRFVRDEIFTQSKLQGIGFSFDKKSGVLVSNHSKSVSKDIIEKIQHLVESKVLGTRGEYRGKPKEALEDHYPELKKNLKPFDSSKPAIAVEFSNKETEKNYPKKTRRTRSGDVVIFGKNLSLEKGDCNNLYRDITDLHNFYLNNRDILSQSFSSLIRMSLRLIVEAAAASTTIDAYVKANFETAKKSLSKDQKTTLSIHSISTPNDLIKLLHIGAHDYSSSSNLEQTIAMSILIGEMLSVTHKKK